MKPCPTVLKVLCIIGICWATLGLLGVVIGVSFHFITLPGATPASIAMKKETWYIVNLTVSTIVNIVTGLLLLFGSIKSLKAEKSGRLLLLTYAWSTIVFGILGSIWGLAVVVPHTLAAAVPPGPVRPGFETVLKITTYAGIGLGILIMLAMPVYILITLRLRKVRDAYEGLFLPQANFEPLMTPP
jgi:hypothetical protein